MSSNPTAVIVLAAGAGTRMRSRTAKVLHPVCGRSMLAHVVAAATAVEPRHLVAVVGHGREQVGPHVHELVPSALLAVQEEQLGTGHAVRVGLDALAEALGGAAGLDGAVVVTTGDTPLLEGSTLATLLAVHRDGGHAVTLLTAELGDPTGYGRVLRDADGSVREVVEQKDATAEQRAVREVNAGIYVFDGPYLAEALGRLSSDNAQGEYYLTDVVGIARRDGVRVGAHLTDDVDQTEGANDRVQLADLAARLNRRTLERWMRAGVTVVDPTSTWIDVTVTLEPDSTVLPGVQLLGTTTVAEDAVVGPDSTLTDVEVSRGARVVRTHAELAVVGEQATVGPFSYLRPGTVVGAGGKIGAFVEAKNAQLGDGAKVPHLSYVGDAEIGAGTNIGAGTIFANYDGVAKHRTVVGRHARTGSNNTFVAPVHIGDGAVTGGGTVVREDVPAGALAVSSPPLRIIADWVARRRAGSAGDRAAREAHGADGAPGARGGTGGE
ncbi:bifunctional UDP-N-acetylglucosamine diphosphorylase/glucosamine-1-phosphate N-acetyltransferase GlmU [Nocardioides sp. HDW12B]|uniref:bifunctional UDP-N-acetylglucosamine diphosphorylase/glucosamine-1-phosphate N-acetyltransferase GlmU n=1 Tax=Nocardioides sp. HDW12B TaxID=2714939 RepID=UPI00140E2582|nr:bifunctional UDP-N-acetylglucosamine diphosphorylase/glucosamine-1-phosphate N-acetyltransferase GlmU [Nocardioides sp. HDW12B]QIK65368.1 bifunctional UDP-N-acetylglucosamine diphosphorylase/glucosamine-1-phosphate N-acetyltransferase GlmU [Nocardioides sp. HDW12B]